MSGEYIDLVYLMLCNTVVSQWWSMIDAAFRREAFPSLWYFPKETEQALDMSLPDCNISGKICMFVMKMGWGRTGGSSGIIKVQSYWRKSQSN